MSIHATSQSRRPEDLELDGAGKVECNSTYARNADKSFAAYGTNGSATSKSRGANIGCKGNAESCNLPQSIAGSRDGKASFAAQAGGCDRK